VGAVRFIAFRPGELLALRVLGRVALITWLAAVTGWQVLITAELWRTAAVVQDEHWAREYLDNDAGDPVEEGVWRQLQRDHSWGFGEFDYASPPRGPCDGLDNRRAIKAPPTA